MSAPELSAVDEASELRAELAATRAELRAAQMQLAALNGTTPPTPQSIDRSSPGWTDRISFHDPGYGEEGGRSFGMNRLRGVGARLKGITSDRDAVQSSIERPELPKPTADEGQLQRDFLKWGVSRKAACYTRACCANLARVHGISGSRPRPAQFPSTLAVFCAALTLPSGHVGARHNV